ncbi:alpha/beta hydrolase (plasmid) [Diaphorobacter sp. HDW4B]|uniref:alpha/beta fold hydrolase n=1 Tax=Diaphorobacter sp. HDW4B TaxID=2714925 RepID=UPI00140C9371|nr:alpha/beta hydrolase [Diaphorobacter sp. HDW4B]QIL74068.1 alpha/beta hydrolase [Diaphorobacter sp. HDW4B]
MPYVTTADGIRAYFDVACNPASGATPLVMVHGASQDSLSWKHNLEAFGADYTVYALDLPAHGKSSTPIGGPHNESMRNARYLVQVLEALELPPAVLMGHSMGGGIVAAAATLAPERVRGLVLVDGASVKVVKSSGYNPAILDMARINPGDWFEVTFRTLMGSATEADRVEDVVMDARRCNPYVAFADICAFGGFRMETLLEHIHCPCVIVEGAEDWSVPPESAKQVHAVLQQRSVPSVYLEWPGVGHFPHSEQPQRFNADTLAAMKSLNL